MRRRFVLRSKLKLFCPCLVFIIFTSAAFGADTPLPGRLETMKAELARNFDALQKEEVPPYYMSYAIDEVRTQYLTGSFGAVVSRRDDSVSATLQTVVRVGSYQMDNTRELRGNALGGALSSAILGSASRAPLNEAKETLAVILWKETDKAYRTAVETFSRVKADQNVVVAAEDKSDDFSKGSPRVSIQKQPDIRVDMDRWADRMRKFTAPFKRYPFILDAGCEFMNEVRYKYLIDTEGSIVATPVNYMRLSITAVTKADDGTELPLYLTWFGYKESDLPSDAAVLKDIDALIANLDKLRAAPIVDPYTGPAILSGKASGVFFHEILGHRLEGHRLKSEAEGQTFKKKVGEKILPEFMSIIFDPTIKEHKGLLLSGAYDFDDEGTPAEKVTAVENGTLRNFLMSRAPTEGFPRSNGHGRGQPGAKPVSRQSNLIVESKNMLSEDKLRQMLIDECKKQNKPFGLLFTEISGGYTQTGRSSPNAFNVTPLVVYRIYTDGRPDEMVRGVNLIGTPLTVFGKIAATGSKPEVFNGTCGAESGSVPVAAISPSILVSEIEVQRAEKSQEKPPILPPPPAKNVQTRNGGR
jgi:predicted Zn-dependent protease